MQTLMTLAFGALVLGLAVVAARRWRRSRAARCEAGERDSPRHPYQCVSIATRTHGCAPACSLAERRFLPAEAPSLPLPGCTQARCICVYLHFEDRRHHQRRAAEHRRNGAGPLADRRISPGRRRSDTAYGH